MNDTCQDMDLAITPLAAWRVLLVEDDPMDADLLYYALRREISAVEVLRVETADEFNAALDAGGWTVVLSDYHVPGFGAPVALPLFRQRTLDIPFLVVSGQVGDEAVASLLRDGANDFVMKGNLRRLLPAIRQAQQVLDAQRARREAEQELASSREQLRDLATFLQTVREDERAHIARDLHDELGQMLTALKLELSGCATQAAAQPELARRLEGARDLTQGLFDTVKRIYADLRPPILDDLGLAAAIEWLVADVCRRSGLAHDCYISDQDFSPPAAQGIALYRTVQEALTNVVRHAVAQRVEVGLVVRAGIAHLHIIDDGAGFDVAAARSRHSFGLLGMQERVRAVGGSVQIDSESGKGTTVYVRLPPPELS